MDCIYFVEMIVWLMFCQALRVHVAAIVSLTVPLGSGCDKFNHDLFTIKLKTLDNVTKSN
jgi:hypothetical protein